MTAAQIPVVLYARLSRAKTRRSDNPDSEATDEVEEASDSIENQLAALRAFAKDQNYIIVDEYPDDGKSGFKGVERPQFSRMLQDMGKGKFQIVLVRHEDRLYRNKTDAERFQTGCWLNGVKFQTLAGGVTDPSTAEGRFMSGVRTEVSIYESALKRERLLMHYEALRAKGELLPSSRTFGWAEDRMSEHPVEADLVRFIFEQVGNDASVGAMVRYLNDNHVPQVRDGARWQHATVTAILNNARYWGAVLEPDGTIREGVQGKWAHLISRETFELAQAKMQHRRDTSTRRPGWHYSTKHLLGGIICCGVCGNLMRSSSSKPRGGGPTFALYRCETNRGFTTTTDEHSRTRKDGLRHASLRVEEVDEAVRRAVVDSYAFGHDIDLPADNTAAEMRRTLSALGALDEEVNRTLARQDDGTLTPTQADARLREVRARREPLEALARTLREQSAAAHMVVDLRAGLAGDSRVPFEDVARLKVQLRERFDALDIENQRSLVRQRVEVMATGGRRSARSPQRFRINHLKVPSLNGLEDEEAA